MPRSSLMAAAEIGEIIGLARQVADPPWREIFDRQPVPQNENSSPKPHPTQKLSCKCPLSPR